MNFLRLSLSDMDTDDSNPKFRRENKKRVRHETCTRFWDNLHRNFTKKIFFTFPLSLRLIYKLIPACLIVSLRNYDPLIKYSLVTAKIFLRDLLSFQRNVLFPLVLYTLTVTTFQPQMLKHIHIFQNFLIIQWMIQR